VSCKFIYHFKMKKKKVISLLICIGILIPFMFQAQTPQQNLDKYWHYRYRLTHYFMKVGMKPGMSMPAISRNGRDANSEGGNSSLTWSEGVIQLGYYIGVLSTEYRLLKDNGASDAELNQTIKELFYALHAVFRLDSIGLANSAIPITGTNFPGIGFMARDDVPSDFIASNCDDLNAGIGCPAIGTTGTYVYSGSGRVGVIGERRPSSEECYSDWNHSSDSYLGHNFVNSACSTDLYYELLMGLSLVLQEVDNADVQFYDGNILCSQYNGTNINLYSMARQLGYQICNYMFGAGTYQLWNYASLSYVGLSPGGDGKELSLPFAHVAARFGLNIPPDPFSNAYWPQIDDRKDLLSPNGQVLPLVCVLAAISNDPGGHFSFWGDGRDDNAMQTIQDICNLGVVSDFSQYGWADFYGSVLLALNPGAYNSSDLSGYSFCNVESMLDDAPDEGPYCHTSQLSSGTDCGPVGWRSDRRFVDYYSQLKYGDDGFRGNYNGLDFMLLYNLQSLISEKIFNTPPAIKSNIPYPVHHIISNQNQGHGQIQYSYSILEPEGSYDHPYLVDEHCSPVIINQLNESSISITNGNNTYSAVGSVTIQGSKEYYVDLNPVATSNYIDVAYQANLDVICDLDCTDNCSPYPYVFQTDPINNMPEADEKRRFSQAKTLSDTLNKSQAVENLISPSLILYPNPAFSQVNINFSLSQNSQINLYLTDIYGKKIANIISGNYISGNYMQVLNISGLPSGMYFVTLETAIGKKVLKLEKVYY